MIRSIDSRFCSSHARTYIDTTRSPPDMIRSMQIYVRANSAGCCYCGFDPVAVNDRLRRGELVRQQARDMQA